MNFETLMAAPFSTLINIASSHILVESEQIKIDETILARMNEVQTSDLSSSALSYFKSLTAKAA